MVKANILKNHYLNDIFCRPSQMQDSQRAQEEELLKMGMTSAQIVFESPVMCHFIDSV